MKASKKDLWLRINGHHFDNLAQPGMRDHLRSMLGGNDPFTQAFASKLALKKGWTHKFALRAIAEYKKFVYLGVSGDTAVTPSGVIDQVWHQHLQFTRAYREFCENVLCENFDHNPELVPAEEQTGVFNAQYQATLDLYRTEFNVDPPEDIWGRPKFDQHKVKANGYEPERKKRRSDDATYYSDSEVPLWNLMTDNSGSHSHANTDFGGFGGGHFGGGGAGNSEGWGDPTPSHASHSDSTSVDTSSHGSDSGGHSCSSSSCSSSSCGSGCGGGGD